MPATRATSLFQRFVHAGLLPQDEGELQLKKALLNLASGLFTLGNLVWLAACWGLNEDLPMNAAAIPALVVTNYALFAWHRHFGPYRFVQLSLLLVFPFFTQWSLGLNPVSSGLGVWAILAPATALLCIGVAGSTPWFLAFLVLTAAAIAFPPPAGNAVFTSIHSALLASVLYPLLRFSASQRSKTRERLADAHRALHLEQERSERLLLNILPAPIAARLKDHTSTIADGHPEVVVMFADIVDYTRIASDMAPPKVFEMLNRIFCRFDELTDQHGLERIKTIGDGYMVAGGLHARPHDAHAAMAALALDMQAALHDHQFTDGLELELRIGIASGPVVAGVVGRGKFIYDLWGDTVNLAHRLCTEGEPSVIQCDGRMFERLRGAFVFAKPILLFLKGKGYVPVYRLRSPRILAVPRHRQSPEAA